MFLGGKINEVIINSNVNAPEITSWEELLEGQPTLLRLMPKLGLSTETGMDLLCILGILISFCCVVFYSARDMVSFTLLWMMYLSLYQVHTMLPYHNNHKKIVEGCTLL